jgi:hypothetical protein
LAPITRVLVGAVSAVLIMSAGLNLWQFRTLSAERARTAEVRAFLVADGAGELMVAEGLIQETIMKQSPIPLVMAGDRIGIVQRMLGRIHRPLLGSNAAIIKSEDDLVGLNKRLDEVRSTLTKSGTLTTEQRNQLQEMVGEINRIRQVVESVAG